MKFHKCIPPSFSSFRYKLLLAFLIATMVPLISLTFISYHISYNIARDRIIDSAVMTDKQLVSQLNDRLGQVENVADTIQFQMYSLNHSSSNKVDALKKFTAVKNNISLYKSTFDFFHIYVFLQPDQLGSKEGCTSFPQMSFLHMVWIKILFPVQAFPLSGYRFPICLCLKYCPQKNHLPM